MKNKLFILILIGLFFSINNSYSKEDHLDELKKISKNIRCLICQGQSIDDSNSDFAINIKYVILKKLNEKITIIVVTHDIGFISQYITKVACINRTLICHPTSELTGETIENLYGTHVHMVHHHHEGEDHH